MREKGREGEMRGREMRRECTVSNERDKRRCCGLLVGVLVVTHDLFGVICKQ